MKKRLIALLLVLINVLSLMGSAAPVMIGEAVAIEDAAAAEATAEMAVTEDYGAAVQKYAVLNSSYADYAIFVHDGSNAFAITEALVYDYAEFEEGLVMVITDWYLDPVSSALWYAVEAYRGALPADAPETTWILQNYTDGSDDEDYLLFVEIEEPEIPQVQCPVCGGVGCEVAHVYCPVCEMFDCGVDHNVVIKPATTPVIPEYTLPEGQDFAIVDGNGNAANATGFVLEAGKQMSLSAWTHLENVSYQWQVRYDHENDLWTDIQGKTDKGILFSAAMLMSVLDSNHMAYLRFTATDGETYITSSAVPVTVHNSAAAGSSSDSTSEDVAMDLPVPLAEGDKALITVEYTLNGKLVGQSYTADAYVGQPFSDTTNSVPEIMGYAPSIVPPIAGAELSADGKSLILSFDEVDGDINISVVFQPAPVNVTIEHYFQNIGDNEYVKDTTKTETIQMITGTTVPGKDDVDHVDNVYAGFYALNYVTPTVAADGSTVVKVYYDRHYYLLNFQLSGGYGASPVFARYGAAIGDVGTPVRAGYTFLHWTKVKEGSGENAVLIYTPEQLAALGTAAPNNALPTTMPAIDTTYFAVWKINATAKVSVVIWGQNADNDGYSYLGTEEIYAKPGTEITWNEGGLICGMTAHTHNNGCTITCTIPTHEHSLANGCYELSCNIVPHNHVDSGCAMTCSHTAHTLDCYSVPTYRYLRETDNGPTNPTDHGNGIYSVYSWGSTYYYLYLNGEWYRVENYNGEQKTNQITFACDHTHSDACYGCGLATNNHSHSLAGGCYELTCTTQQHAHSNACEYSCGLIGHTHNNDCYANTDLVNNTLWNFKYSETVQVAADGSTILNVYYVREEFTLTFKDGNSVVATIKARWGAEISDEFQKAPFNTTYNGRAWKCTEPQKYGYALQTLDRMPQFNATFDLYKKSDDVLKTIYYYVENVGANVSETTWPNNTNNFTLLKQVDTYFNYATYNEEYHEIEGFKRYSKQVSGFTVNNSDRKNFSNKTLYLYYLRESYNIEFSDGYSIVNDGKVEYGANLSAYNSYVPDLPSQLPPNSHRFAGWYLNPECTGEQVDLNTFIMPAENVILYAKWEEVTFTIRFFLDRAKLDEGVTIPQQLGAPYDQYFDDHKLKYGEKLHGEHDIGTAGGADNPHDYSQNTFVGWFYLKDGEEVPFDVEEMIVEQDMDLFAKWTSDVLRSYTVYYAYKDAEGNTVYIAEPTTGQQLAGHTVTVDAKGGSELYAAYQTKYFPQRESHNITISMEEFDENNNPINVYTFWYDRVEAIPYTVRYLDENGNSLLPDKVVADNAKSVVIENAEQIEGYIPDKFDDKLIITKNGENVITFVYSENTKNAYVQYKHIIQMPDGTWYVYKKDEQLGNIGSVYYRESIEISGYEFDPVLTEQFNSPNAEQGYEFGYDASDGKPLPAAVSWTDLNQKTQIQGTLTKKGLELNLYYKCSNADLTIQKTVEGYTPDAGENFVFTIRKGSEAPMKVVVNFNGTSNTASVTIKGLAPGSYTVREDTDWSWRYEIMSPAGATANVDMVGTNKTVEFKNEFKNPYWLSDETTIDNRFQSNN